RTRTSPAMNPDTHTPRRRFDLEKTLSNLSGRRDISSIAQRVVAFANNAKPEPTLIPTAFAEIRLGPDHTIVITNDRLKNAADHALRVHARGIPFQRAIEMSAMAYGGL